MRPFLIVGLPRSRTLWMAEFMSCFGAVCVHEPTEYMKSIDDLPKVFADNEGVSDSGLSLWIERIFKDIAPWTVIIWRDQREVEASIERLGIPKSNYCDLLLERLNKVRNHPLVMNLPFECMNDMRVMQKVFWHLRPNVPFDEQRFELMKNVNIQCDIEKKSKAAQNAVIYDEFKPLYRLKE